MEKILDICISSAGNDVLLLECLSSLKAQSLPLNSFRVFVITKNSNLPAAKNLIDFFQFQFATVIGLNDFSAAKSRNWMINHSQSQLVYFLDEDCSLENPDHLKNLVAFHKIYPELTVIGGRYAHGALGTSWGEAYNFMCDSWLDQNLRLPASKNNTYFVGGNISLKLNTLSRQIQFDEELGFGGEDLKYIQKLREHGHKTWLTNGLTVQHHSQHTLKSFFSRAWLHGKVKKSIEPNSAFQTLRKGPHFFKKRGPLKSKGLAALYFGCVQASYLTNRPLSKENLSS